MVDMKLENKFELWEDEIEASKDLYNKEQPLESLLHLANNTQCTQREFIQDCLTSTTTQAVGSINTRTPESQNPSMWHNDPFHVLELIDNRAYEF
jgi:hypothetical protein